MALKTKNGLITGREINEARWPYTCSRPCAFDEKNEKKNTKFGAFLVGSL